MNAFWGADTDALRTIGSVCSRRSELLADIESMLSSTIDNVEWIGEDAERFRADWAGIVRPGLLDQSVELRHHARRLTQHADEQEAASSLGGWSGGGDGGWSSAGAFLQDVAQMAQDAIRDLLGGGALGEVRPGGQDGPFAELLRAVLSTPEGRATFLGSFLGSVLGGLLADMIGRALEMGMVPENLLTGLGVGGGLSNLIGETTQLGVKEQIAAGAGGAGVGSEDAASGGGGETGGESGGSSGGASGAGGGSGPSGGSGAGGGEVGGVDASSEVGGGDAAGGAHPMGVQGTSAGAEQSAGSLSAGRIELASTEGPQSLLDRLLEMVGDVITPGDASGSVIGNDIGHSGLDVARR